MNSFKGKLLADYHQLLIQDDYCFDGGVAWRPEALSARVVAGAGYLVISTARVAEVEVEVVVSEVRPKIGYEQWDQITEGSINVRSGVIRICGMTDYYPDCPILQVEKCIYGALVCFRGLGTISEDELDGEDAYSVFLWPQDAEISPQISKRWSEDGQ